MKIIKKDGNSVMMKSEKGIDIKLVFKEDDNPEIENMVTNNLMMSYEQRIKEDIVL